MVGRKPKTVGLFDLPIRLTCLFCGAEVKVPRKNLRKMSQAVCCACHSEFPVSEMAKDDALLSHSLYIKSLQDKLS